MLYLFDGMQIYTSILELRRLKDIICSFSTHIMAAKNNLLSHENCNFRSILPSASWLTLIMRLVLINASSWKAGSTLSDSSFFYIFSLESLIKCWRGCVQEKSFCFKGKERICISWQSTLNYLNSRSGWMAQTEEKISLASSHTF